MLQYAINNGIINLSYVQEQVKMNKRKELLQKHPNKIWQGKDEKWYTYMPNEDGDGRKLVKRSTKKRLEDVVVEFYKMQAENPTFKETFNDWVDEKLRYGEICEGTYGRYKNDYIRFCSDKSIESIRMKYLDENELYEFIKSTIHDMHLTAKSYAGLRTIIQGTLKYAKRKKYTEISASTFFADIDIGKNSFKKRIKDKSKEVFLDSEVKMISHYVSENPTIRNLGILLAFQTGVRVGELASLKRGDINFNTKTIHIQRTEITYKDKETGKSVNDVREYPKNENADRYIIIPDNAIQTIRKALTMNGFGEYLFEEGGKRIRENAFNRRLSRICNILNIPHRSMHKIRKTYGTILLDNYTDESLVIEQMGHKDIKTTKTYYYFCNRDNEEKRKQITNAITC